MALLTLRNVLRKLVERWELLAPIEGTVYLNGSILFQTDNTYDIGISGATRPRDIFAGRNIAAVTVFVSDKIELVERSEPTNSPADTGWLFVKDNGAGKSQLCVRFASGATQVIATEP